MHFEKLVISVASDLNAIRHVRRSCTFVQFEPVGHAESYLGKRMAEVHRMHFKELVRVVSHSIRRTAAGFESHLYYT